MIKGALTVASGFGRKRGLLILTYHRTLEHPDPCINDLTGSTFMKHAEMLSRYCNVVRLDQAAEMLSEQSLPPRAVSITFDDGYADNYSIALPILKRYGLTATFFIATGYLDGGVMWNDIVIHSVKNAGDDAIQNFLSKNSGVNELATMAIRVKLINSTIQKLKYLGASARNEKALEFADMLDVNVTEVCMMRSEQVRELAEEGMEIGAHTVNHPILKKLEIDEAEKEIDISRSTLRNITGRKITSFAYPNGRPGRDFDSTHVALLKNQGFKAAVTTRFGRVEYTNDPLELPRVSAWHEYRGRFVARLMYCFLKRGE